MNQLEKDEALPAPLYVVAALLVLLPGIDFLQAVGGIQPANIQWRFATVGVLSSYLATPLLGAAVAIVVASLTGRHGLRRGLAYGCFALSAVLVLLSMGFTLDALQLRNTVRPDALGSFEGASARAVLKLLLAAGALAFLGWRAVRIATPARPRVSRRAPVPLVTGAETQPRAGGRAPPANEAGQGDARTAAEPARQ